MFKKRIQMVAQVVGFVTLSLLALYGALTLFGGEEIVRAATGVAAPGLASFGSAPAYINYHGELNDSLGEPVSGVYTMTISIYNLPAGGTQLWWETHRDVTVRDGRFSVLLGDGTSRSGELAPALFKKPDRYVALTVDGTTMEPRQRFVSVPYAFHAYRASGLSAPDGDPLDAMTVNDNGQVILPGGSYDPVIKTPGIFHIGGGKSLIVFDQSGVRISKNWQGEGHFYVEGTSTVGGNLTVNGKVNLDNWAQTAELRPGDGYWGNWNSYQTCPVGSYVCAIATRIEPPQGEGDDTAMNGIRAQCCSLGK